MSPNGICQVNIATDQNKVSKMIFKTPRKSLYVKSCHTKLDNEYVCLNSVTLAITCFLHILPVSVFGKTSEQKFSDREHFTTMHYFRFILHLSVPNLWPNGSGFKPLVLKHVTAFFIFDWTLNT